MSTICEPVELVLRIDARLHRLVRVDTTARIIAEGMIGARVVDLKPGEADATPVAQRMPDRVTLGSDEDDYIITVTCDKDEQKHSHLVDAIKRLRPAVVKRLLQFDREFKNLQQ